MGHTIIDSRGTANYRYGCRVALLLGFGKHEHKAVALLTEMANCNLYAPQPTSSYQFS